MGEALVALVSSGRLRVDGDKSEPKPLSGHVPSISSAGLAQDSWHREHLGLLWSTWVRPGALGNEVPREPL